ncbi:SigE family RNA polymerase sigma factor [Nocardioides sp.]|uniref:SigE family RNA polymerase sigma factor n=1 Tax=Nocardioides sp. TaxID=35761 RepID=UPI002C37B8B1|nr:SigE family RNA polymerase sigma factor [Nocardioides sp.]HXH80424.1 SigE family RNA polymerase sigma factor [Nocardioides sp.]
MARHARQHEAAFSDYVVARQDWLRRVAYALCGDWHRADDLVQEALTKLYLAWPRLRDNHDPDAYVRKILVRASIDAHRHRERRVPTVALVADRDVAHRLGMPLEEHDALITALQALPEQQRKVVVLRHWLGLSVRETATELGINEGTVKSHSSRGLAALQLALGEQHAV